jgi:hypothetical protein
LRTSRNEKGGFRKGEMIMPKSREGKFFYVTTCSGLNDQSIESEEESGDEEGSTLTDIGDLEEIMARKAEE